jgi:hypothetical protein
MIYPGKIKQGIIRTGTNRLWFFQKICLYLWARSSVSIRTTQLKPHF